MGYVRAVRWGATRARTQRPVQPRFVPSTVREPPVSPTDCNVEDQIERLVEGGRVWTVDPGVLEHNLLGTVGDHLREVAAFKEWLVEAEVDREVKPSVDVHVPKQRGRNTSVSSHFPSEVGTNAHEILCPLQAEVVEALVVRGTPFKPPA